MCVHHTDQNDASQLVSMSHLFRLCLSSFDMYILETASCRMHYLIHLDRSVDSFGEHKARKEPCRTAE